MSRAMLEPHFGLRRISSEIGSSVSQEAYSKSTFLLQSEPFLPLTLI